MLCFFEPRTALAGIVTLLHACLDMKSIILGKYHYVLYFIVLAMQVSAMFYPSIFFCQMDVNDVLSTNTIRFECVAKDDADGG